MEGQPRQVKHGKHPHHPHHVVPKHESGYTDEAAVECHDLIDRAEEEAHLHDPNSMYATQGVAPTVDPGCYKAEKWTEHHHHDMPSKKTGGLEGSSTGSSATEKAAQTGKNIKDTVGEKMGQMKETMTPNK